MFTLTQFMPPFFRLPRAPVEAQPQERHYDDALLEDHQLNRDQELCSGGYNEAFIAEHWARYTPGT